MTRTLSVYGASLVMADGKACRERMEAILHSDNPEGHKDGARHILELLRHPEWDVKVKKKGKR